ncbi:L-rhamnose mutarotase [Halanaerocella petrolearia]
MLRKAFIMKVDQDAHEEYKKRHDEIWPEMVDMLKEYGADNYSIFLDEETSKLFAYLEIEDEEKWAKSSETEICQKWWTYMKDIMPTNPDNSPKSKNLELVFHLD